MGTLSERLKSHYQTPLKQQKKLSKMARFRNHFDDINLAIEHGVSLAVVLDELNQDGLTISIHTLKKMLQRVRKEKGITSTNKSVISNLNKPEISHPLPSDGAVPHSNPEIAEANKQAEMKYVKLDANYVKLEEYAHIARFRKINGDITHFGKTSEEEYYSLGKDPRELKKLSPRKKSVTVAEFLMTVMTHDYVYKNIIKE